MPKYLLPRICKLQDIPEFQRLQRFNADKLVNEKSAVFMYGLAIHWMTFLEILWPHFEEINRYSIEVKVLTINDPDRDAIPPVFYQQVCEMLKFFWTMQLEDLYPNGDWDVEIWDDPEMTVQVTIRKR